MNGVVETPGKLRNMSYLGLAFKRVLLVEPSSHSPRHIVVVSKRPNGTWLIMLVDKRPEPALIRELITHDDEQAIAICGFMTSCVNPVIFCDLALEHVDTGNGTVTADQCELISIALGSETRAA